MKSNLLAHGRRWVFSSVNAILGLVWLALAGSVKLAAAPAEPGPLDFIRAQGERRYTKVPREVLAFYYTWYGTPETQGRSVHWGRINPEQLVERVALRLRDRTELGGWGQIPQDHRRIRAPFPYPPVQHRFRAGFIIEPGAGQGPPTPRALCRPHHRPVARLRRRRAPLAAGCRADIEGAFLGRPPRYVPLATLKDAPGQSLGEGIAYVELNTPPLRNGKTLYVWMRMPDVLGVNEGLFALFRFAAEKLGPR